MQRTYAILPDRIKAVVIDAIVIVGTMYAIAEVLALFSEVPNFVRIVLFVLIFFLYDPLFTSLNGGTIGHTYSNITVRKDNDNLDRLNFPAALIRFALKSLLGWLSLLTTTADEKKKAIHDMVAKSVVLELPKTKNSK
ncbi:RDD family protein [Croceivirga thetidis]|uniref:RDD family protein n=1 Tax=Croceivirga thetidis TaxID=2721623 RepID=A0ABX1GUA4_9FLAO|nr:RDD family protein [Croceivirga thetidis]NKI33493.1 RDD family protein [Croceivirga thetidis]